MKDIVDFIPECTASDIKTMLLEVISPLRIVEWFRGVTRRFSAANIEARLWD